MIEKNPKIPESMVVLTSEPKDIKFTIKVRPGNPNICFHQNSS